MGATDAGRSELQDIFHMCSTPRAPGKSKDGSYHDDVWDIVQWAQGIWGTISMGNYPYPSSYLLHGLSLLPAWPVQTACLPLEFPLTSDRALLEAVRESVCLYFSLATVFLSNRPHPTCTRPRPVSRLALRDFLRNLAKWWH